MITWYRSSLFTEGPKKHVCFHIFCIISLLISVSLVKADLGPENILLLVNADSATSRYVARMYRQYYPAITDEQVLELNGLADCSGPNSTAADEIITRDVYNNSIAWPVLTHLWNHGLLDQVMVIVTTAGMPYRIEDTNPSFANVIYPGGSNWQLVADNESMINAASVESELTCLWYGDAGSNPAGLQNRIVNPYQACRSGFDLFERSVPYSSGLRWTKALSLESGVAAPIMEGDRYYYGTRNRTFGPGHIYLTCRLDGPKKMGKSAVFAVRNMLERSRRASDPARGVNPSKITVVLDDAPFDAETGMNNLDFGRTYNLHSSMQYWEYQGVNSPPNAYYARNSDDYVGAFEQIGELAFDYEKMLTAVLVPSASDILVCLDYRSRGCMHQNLLNQTGYSYPERDPDQLVMAYATFGRNGDEGRGPDYLYTGGDYGGQMFNLSNGAIFTSLESFNAVTLFSDQATTQAKIIDFVDIGGSGAIGHSFEPQADAAVDNEFVFYNFLADQTGPDGIPDGRADLTFAEAAWSGIPYLSWTEVVIGDPLMRVCYGPGEDASWTPLMGDSNMDDRISSVDMWSVRWTYGGMLETDDPSIFEKYHDLCDTDKNGVINSTDMYTIRYLYGSGR